MPRDKAVKKGKESTLTPGSKAIVPVTNGNDSRTVAAPSNTSNRLRFDPHEGHKGDNYEDLGSEYPPLLFTSLERYLPQNLLNASRDTKYKFMLDILRRYSTEGERTRVEKLGEYKDEIISKYQPLHRELYALNPAMFFVESFLKVFNANDNKKEEGIKSIMFERAPGVYSFDMLQPRFCEMLISEVENFEKWVYETKISIFLPSTMSKFGAVLDDLGMETMLTSLMYEFIHPISKIFFSDVGGHALDSHHGFVLEYGMHGDDNMGFHVDDSEVTLNVCLGRQFTGGELSFKGLRCEKHVNTDARPEENFSYSQVPGHAVIYRGCHRHGASATTAGHRLNLVLWCKSLVFRELRKHLKEPSGCCGECKREKQERDRQFLAVQKMELVASKEEIASLNLRFRKS